MARERSKERKRKRVYYDGNLEQMREYWRERNATHRKENREKSRKWKKANPEKRRAGNRIYKAIRRGKMEREPCEICGEEKAQGQHFDYTKPLEVIWLCGVCHGIVHRLLNDLVRILTRAKIKG